MTISGLLHPPSDSIMKKIFVLAGKEFMSFFRSWTGVLSGGFFFLVTGIFFVVLVLSYAKISMNPRAFGLSNFANLNQTQYVFGSFFLNVNVLLIFLVPMLSMRAFAEERRHETLELLFTYPLSDFEIVAGKLIGLVCFFSVLLSPLAGYGALFCWAGGEIDWGPVLAGFAGFWVLGVAYLAAGVFMSSLTRSPVVSAIGTFGVLVVFWMLDAMKVGGEGMGSTLFSALSPISHYRNFTYGILDLRDVVYFVFFFFYFLFLALRSVETRNWRNV